MTELQSAQVADLVLARLRREAGAPPLDPDAWPDPIMPGAISVPEIGADLLPSWCRAMADAVARSTQTPPAAAVMTLLAVLAAVLQRRFEVAPFGDDYREPVSLWTLTALPSGSRKSAVIGSLLDAVVKWEKLARDRARGDIARAEAAREVALKRIEKLKHDAGREDDSRKRNALEFDIQREKQEMPPEVFAPRIFCSDVTAERLQQLLCEQDERISILSDEAGIFQIMSGAYSGGVASLDVFLQGHAGSPLRVDRGSRLAHLDRPALSFGLALQPDILAETGKSKRFRGSGLLARFLYAMPVSNVGSRDVRQRVPLDADARRNWEKNILALLENQPRPLGKPKILPFDAEGREIWLDLAEEIEREQGAGGRYEHFSDWTSKLPGAAARVAALLAVAEWGPDLAVVDAGNVRRACDLARRLIPHAEAAFRLMGAGGDEGDALALLAWLRRGQLLRFTRREAHRAMEARVRTVERLIPVIARLQEWQIVSRERTERDAMTGRSSTVYYVNPKALSPEGFVDLSK